MMQTNRLTRLRKAMEADGTQALFVTNATNRAYISGFTGSSGLLLITLERALLFSDFRYRTQAPQQAPHFEFIEHGSDLIEQVNRAASELKVRRLAFEAHDLNVATHDKYKAALNGVQLYPAEQWVERLRMVKDDSEIAVIREAAKLVDDTFTHITGKLRPGISERDVALEIEFYMRRNGATGTSFETIVASGERSALPHGVASDRILRTGEFVKLDYGAYYHSYCSDITRTVMLGQPTERHREIYEIVLLAQQAVLNGLRPGMTGRQADAIARDIISAHGYGHLFGHGTGHGIGLEIHEGPRLSLTSDTVLEPGMIVTVEPGIYIEGFGGVRIEDDVVITDSGVEILTHAPKNFIVIA